MQKSNKSVLAEKSSAFKFFCRKKNKKEEFAQTITMRKTTKLRIKKTKSAYSLIVRFLLHILLVRFLLHISSRSSEAL
jgi:hypothetical protein